MKKVTILFDLDGTLIDSTDAILDGFEYAFKLFGQNPPPKEKILALIGHPLDFMFLHLGAKGDIQKYVDAYKKRYHETFTKMTTLLPKADKAIEKAASFANLGVVTTKTGEYSKELLDYFGVLDYFGCVIGREDVIHPKPNPEPLLKAMRFLNARKEHTWMVGDTCLDMDGAKNAQIRGVAVLCGYGCANELARCASYLEPGPLEAVEFIYRFENRLKTFN